MLKKMGTDEKLPLADVASNLSKVLGEMGKHAEAKEFDRQVVTEYKAVLELGVPLGSRRLNTLALKLQDLGDGGAEKFYLEAIDLDRKSSDERHLAVVLNNFASFLVTRSNKADLPEAKRRCEEAVTLNEKHLDSFDPEFARNRETLSRIYDEMDDELEAAIQIQKAWT